MLSFSCKHRLGPLHDHRQSLPLTNLSAPGEERLGEAPSEAPGGPRDEDYAAFDLHAAAAVNNPVGSGTTC